MELKFENIQEYILEKLLQNKIDGYEYNDLREVASEIRKLINEVKLPLEELSIKGGKLVSSGECSEMEIVFAKSEGRFFVVDTFGFIRREI